jgi:glycosyltransferase involved in cell wall biosynthesis
MSPFAPRRVAMFVINDMRLDSRVRREAATLAGHGHDVTVYAVLSDATSHLAVEQIDGYTIVRVPMLMRPAGEPPAGGDARASTGVRRALAAAFVATRPLLGGSLHFLANWQLRWRAWSRRVVAQAQPADIWHAHDLNTLPLAIECADRFGGAVVYDSHEIFTEAGSTSQLPATMRAILRRLERGWARRATAVVTVNDSVADLLGTALERDDVIVVRNCAAPPLEASPLRRLIGVGDHDRVVLYHGSVTVGRGLERLVAAFEDPRLERAHLVIMGFGPLRPTLEELAARSPASRRIHLLPPVPPAELTSWVAGADVAAMPIEPTTLNHRLSSPNKLFEAIAAGVPVVGPDFVEFRRIVTDGPFGPLGVLHADHDPGTIAAAIDALAALPDEGLAAYRERCRQAAATRWNWDREKLGLVSLYAAIDTTAVVADVARAPVVAPLAGEAE